MENTGHGCLAMADATGTQATERFEKKEKVAPSVFHVFLGATCERPLNLFHVSFIGRCTGDPIIALKTWKSQIFMICHL